MNKFKLEWNRDFRLLAVATFCLSVCFGIHSAIFNNFLVDKLHIQPEQFGIVEALREVPGFLTVIFAAIAMRMPAPILAGLCLIIMGIGMSSYYGVFGIGSLIAVSVFWSLGFHGWMPPREALALGLSDEHKGKRLGELRSVDSVGMLMGIGLVFLAISMLGFRLMYICASVMVIIGGLVMFLIVDRTRVVKQPRFVLKKRYAIYYILAFLQGCRRQIFMTFAVFALVYRYGTSARSISVLMFINTVANMILAPVVGRIIDRIGERKALSASFMGLALIFWGYATIKIRPILYVLYCADNLIFLLGIAMTTYLNKIAEPEDIRPALSMGITVDHVAAVIMPLVGGILWARFSYVLIFQIGAVVALVSLAVCQKVTSEGSAPRQSG